jgi:tRNA (cytidine/uridine-2'-O-)-methyltransferase
MDYADKAAVHHHATWEEFHTWTRNEKRRIILLDAKAETAYTRFSFQEGDILLMGQESSGVPEDVFQVIPRRLFIPISPDCRSLNVSIAAAMVVGEGLRQLGISK